MIDKGQHKLIDIFYHSRRVDKKVTQEYRISSKKLYHNGMGLYPIFRG